MRHRVSPGGSSRVWKKRVRVEKALGEQNLPSIEFQKNRVYTTTFLPSKWNSKKKSFIYPHLPSFHRKFKKRVLYIPTFLPSIGNSKKEFYISPPSFLPYRIQKSKVLYPNLPSFHREFKNQRFYIPTFLPSIGN